MYESEWQDYIDRRVPVTIAFRDGMWAVTADEDPEFWLDAFEEAADAEAFCRDHGFPHKMEE